MVEEKDVVGWEQTKAAPKNDAPSAEDPKSRTDGEKPKFGSDERARLANSKRT